jgi:hypothetical protein
MANSAIRMQNFGDLQTCLNIFLNTYNLSLDDIEIESSVIIDEVLSVMKNVIDSQFQSKLSEKQTAFELQLQQFLYMYDAYCSDKCRESVFPRCVSFLHKFGLHFNDFVVSNVSSIPCITSMLEKMLVRMFDKKIESKRKAFQSERDEKFKLMKRYFEDRTSNACVATTTKLSTSGMFTFSDVIGAGSGESGGGGGSGETSDGELFSLCSEASETKLLRSKSETNIEQCIREIQKLNETSATQ